MHVQSTVKVEAGLAEKQLIDRQGVRSLAVQLSPLFSCSWTVREFLPLCLLRPGESRGSAKPQWNAS